MSDYEAYLRAYAATQTGQALPEVTGVRAALAVALGVRDAKEKNTLVDQLWLMEILNQKLA